MCLVSLARCIRYYTLEEAINRDIGVIEYLTYYKILYYTSRAKYLVIDLFKEVKIIIYYIDLLMRYKVYYIFLL